VAANLSGNEENVYEAYHMITRSMTIQMFFLSVLVFFRYMRLAHFTWLSVYLIKTFSTKIMLCNGFLDNLLTVVRQQ